MGGRLLAQWPPIILPLMRKLTVYSFFLGLGLLAIAVCRILASEFPERECCDPVYPLPAPPASTTPYPSAATPTGRSGEKRQWRYSVLFCGTTVQGTVCDLIYMCSLPTLTSFCFPRKYSCRPLNCKKINTPPSNKQSMRLYLFVLLTDFNPFLFPKKIPL